MTDDLSRRRFAVALASTGIGLGLAGCSSGGASDSTDSETASPTESNSSDDGESFEATDVVDMTDDLTFEPKRIEVEAGTTVTWENVGSVGHSITAYGDEIPEDATYFASGGFDSQDAAADAYPDEGNVTEGGSYEHTFETEGEYEYYCIPHEMNGMVGTVRVV